jgi:hypothetical protein
MRASTAGIMIVAVNAVAAQLCPAANNLWYRGSSGALYQVSCDVEYWTQTNLASRSIADPIACARYVPTSCSVCHVANEMPLLSACDSWTTENPTKPCAAGSWERSTSLCYLKPGDLTAQRRNNTNVVSTIRVPPV